VMLFLLWRPSRNRDRVSLLLLAAHVALDRARLTRSSSSPTSIRRPTSERSRRAWLFVFEGLLLAHAGLRGGLVDRHGEPVSAAPRLGAAGPTRCSATRPTGASCSASDALDLPRIRAERLVRSCDHARMLRLATGAPAPGSSHPTSGLGAESGRQRRRAAGACRRTGRSSSLP
jgi:hypothetical protein